MISEHLLAALEQLVWRYRALQPGPADAYLYAETITAEAAWQIDLARRSLHPRQQATAAERRWRSDPLPPRSTAPTGRLTEQRFDGQRPRNPADALLLRRPEQPFTSADQPTREPAVTSTTSTDSPGS
mgnify:FL=1